MFVFFFNVSATTEIYTYWHTLSLHDALPISVTLGFSAYGVAQAGMSAVTAAGLGDPTSPEERVVALQAELAEVKTAAKAHVGKVEQRQDLIAAVLAGRSSPEEIEIGRAHV